MTYQLAAQFPPDWPNLTLEADDIRWDLDGGAPWPESHGIVETAVRAVPVIDDELAAGIILELLATIVNLRERGRSIEQFASVGLDELHRRHLTDVRRQRMRDHRRHERRKAVTS